MILNWMFASAVFAALVAVAATLAERSLASAGKARRTPWLLALGVATAWPLVAGAWFLLKPAAQPIAMIKTRIGATAARAISEQFTFAPALSPIVQRALIGIWIVASLLLIVRIVIALARMRSVTRASEPMTMDGTEVLLSETAGPAVCGAIAPQIVLPRWILELDAPLRAIVLRHEREHVARGDAGAVLGAALSVALVPWSPAVWVMARRLRLAVELDCDSRVLASNEDPNRYGRLLMLVAQRQTHARLQPMLAESSAHLERRITEMNNSGKNRSRVRAAAFGTIAAGVVILAGSSPVMAGIARPQAIPSPLRYANEVLKLPTVRTTVPEPPRSVEVRLSDSRVQGRGQATQPPPPPPAKQEFFEFKLSRMAEEAQNTQRPRYPEILKEAGVEGDVLVQYVVRPDSTILPGSMKVISSSHALFEAAVRYAIPGMRFNPAMVEGRAVSQLIQQQFEFRVAGSSQSAEIFVGDTIVRNKVPFAVRRLPTPRQEDTLRRSNPPRVHQAPNVVITASPPVKKP